VHVQHYSRRERKTTQPTKKGRGGGGEEGHGNELESRRAVGNTRRAIDVHAGKVSSRAAILFGLGWRACRGEGCTVCTAQSERTCIDRTDPATTPMTYFLRFYTSAVIGHRSGHVRAPRTERSRLRPRFRGDKKSFKSSTDCIRNARFISRARERREEQRRYGIRRERVQRPGEIMPKNASPKNWKHKTRARIRVRMTRGYF